MQNSSPKDCLIVGAGLAGLTAALYLCRFERRVIVVDHGHSRARAIERTRNFPGFPQGVSGQDLLRRLREQLAEVDGKIVSSEISSLKRHPTGGFVASGRGHEVWYSQTVLLATGVVDGVPSLEGIELLQQKGLLRQCPICDGFEHRGQRILVLGDGLHAASEAAFIARFSPHVSHACLTEMRPGGDPGVRLLPALAIRIELTPGNAFRLHLEDGSRHEFDVAYAALRVEPRSGLGRELGANMDAQGNLIVDEHAATNVVGLYAAGDVVKGLDQLVVAAAQGAMAATAIHNLLRQAGPDAAKQDQGQQ